MSMISVEHLTFSYSSSYDEIFKDVSFRIDTDWKLGFVGRNARGKTTFLNLLLNKYEYSGKIISDVKFDYFPFEVKNKETNVIDIVYSICGDIEIWEYIKELSYLNVDTDVLYRSYNSLSNGEAIKVLLAALFLKEANFLLLDEPTSHLDIESKIQIANYLKRKKGFILVSHDRYILDECIDHILSINRSNIEIRSGNYTSFIEDFTKIQDNELNKNIRLKKEIEKMKKSSKQSEIWSNKVEASKRGAADKGYVGHKAAKMMKRSKNIEARKDKMIDEKSKLLKNVETSEKLKIEALNYHKDVLISYNNVSIIYDDKKICDNVSFDIRRAERIFLKGINGSGKSSLIKALFDEYHIKYEGKIEKGSNLKISYIPQDVSNLSGSLKSFINEYDIDETLFKAILIKLDFSRDQFDKDIKDYSLGQKKKVMIAKSLCEKAHIYIWDEPLNYIDIYSRNQIEELIINYQPTMLIVEHDIVFENKIATKIIKI